MSANMTTTKHVMKRAFVDIHLIKMLDITAERTYGERITRFNFTNFFSAKNVDKFLLNMQLHKALIFFQPGSFLPFQSLYALPEMPDFHVTLFGLRILFVKASKKYYAISCDACIV